MISGSDASSHNIQLPKVKDALGEVCEQLEDANADQVAHSGVSSNLSEKSKRLVSQNQLTEQ